MCCVTDGVPWSIKQYHLKPEAKEDHQLNPGEPSNRRKSSGLNQLNLIAIGRGHLYDDPDLSTGVQLKSAAKFSTVIGLITKYVDCHMTFTIANTFLTHYYFYKTDQKNQFYP